MLVKNEIELKSFQKVVLSRSRVRTLMIIEKLVSVKTVFLKREMVFFTYANTKDRAPPNEPMYIFYSFQIFGGSPLKICEP